MKFLKGAGIAWGLIYFAVGAISSFTLNSVDFWSSITLLTLTFLLPLPVSVVAFWFPRTAGIALILSVVLCVTTLFYSSGVKDTLTAFPGIRFYIPHLVFSVAYIMTRRASKNVNSGDGGSSVGAA